MMERTYKAIQNQNQSDGVYSIVPLRSKDRYKIMKWRNEQLYHLRQDKLLTIEDQDNYFNTVIAKEFDREKPAQLLFSFLKNGICIGYGGLVHINYIDKNAEVSFIMDTDLEMEFFETNWLKFLNLLEKIAFEEINFHKIFTFAYDLRPYLYNVLLKAGFYEEAILIEHCLFNDKYINVIIHSKINKH